MSKYKTRQIYKERFESYVENFHTNQVKNHEQKVVPDVPISKDKLKTKSKNKQQPINPDNIEHIEGGNDNILGSNNTVKKIEFKPLWAINPKYVIGSGSKLRLTTVNKGFERDSI
jgi:hypothetical protein